jgi:hypothetical protein
MLRAEERAAFDREIRVIGINLENYKRFDERPLDERVDAFRHSVMNWVGLSGVLLFINAAMTKGPPWFLIPSGLMFLNVLRHGRAIWSDGVAVRSTRSRRNSREAPRTGARPRCRRNRGAARAAAPTADARAARGAARAARRARRALRRHDQARGGGPRAHARHHEQVRRDRGRS